MVSGSGQSDAGKTPMQFPKLDPIFDDAPIPFEELPAKCFGQPETRIVRRAAPQANQAPLGAFFNDGAQDGPKTVAVQFKRVKLANGEHSQADHFGAFDYCSASPGLPTTSGRGKVDGPRRRF
jgi:hypothetical protein